MRLGKNLCELIRIMFMKKLVINAASVSEAKEMAAEQGLTVVHDSTPSWKKAGTPAVGSQEFYDFAADALKANKLVDAKGVGIIVSAILLLLRFVVRTMAHLLVGLVRRRKLRSLLRRPWLM